MIPERKGDIVYCPTNRNFYKVTGIRHVGAASGLGWSLKFVNGDNPGINTTFICKSEYEKSGFALVSKELWRALWKE